MSVMFRFAAVLGLSLVVAGLEPALVAQQTSPASRFWAQWRGPHASGVSRTATRTRSCGTGICASAPTKATWTFRGCGRLG